MVMQHVVQGFNLEACSDAPRWRINDTVQLTLEPTVSPEVVNTLKAIGHQPHVLDLNNLDIGSAQLIAPRLRMMVAQPTCSGDGQATTR